MSTEFLCGAITVVTILLLFTKYPKGITATFGALMMVVTGVTDFQSAFSLYSSSTVIIIISMMVVGAALYETGMAAYLGHLITKVTGTNETKLAISFILVGFVLSGFLAPDSLFFMFMPLVIATADSAKIPFPRVLYPFMTGCMIGSYLTLIGSTANLNSNNMLVEMGFEGWGFLELMPSAFLQLATLIPITIIMLKKNVIPNRPVSIDYASLEPVKIPEKLNPKMFISGGVLIVAILLMICNFKWLPTAVIAGFAAVAVIYTGCVSFNVAFAQVNWNIILMMSGMTAIAKCIQKVGLFNGIVSSIGGELVGSTLLVCMVFYIIGAIGTQFMNNSAWVTVVTPIALALAAPLEIEAKALAGMVLAGSTSCMLTPMATTIAAPIMEMSNMSLKELFRCGFYIFISSIIAAVAWLFICLV